MIKQIGLTAAFILALAAPAEVSAKPIKITRQTLGQFRQLDPAERFVCFQDPRRGRARLGVINRPTLRAGVSWTEETSAALIQKINRLRREIERLGRGRPSRKKTKQIAKKNKQLAQAMSRLRTVEYFEEVCFEPEPRPEFLGDPASLAPYRQNLTHGEVAYLLRKVAFTGSPALERIGREQGLDALVDALVDGTGLPDTSPGLERDSMFFVDKTLSVFDDDPERRKHWTTYSLQVGQYYRFLHSDTPFHEWMQLFLSAHFATNLTAINFSGNYGLHLGIKEHWEMLKRNVLGNFATLTKEMILDSAMNAWLNNDDNRADSPNQNFAREILELFTLGAVDPITLRPNYGEESIIAATGYLSGFYEDVYYYAPHDEYTRIVRYNPDFHDQTPRTVFPGVPGAEATYAFDYTNFPDHVLFNHPGAARYLGERLFAQMVVPNVRPGVVSELAADLIAGGYELRPIIKKILRSSAMFSGEAKSVCVSAPVELYVNLGRQLLPGRLSQRPAEVESSILFLANMIERGRVAGQAPYEPPSVFAWKGACGLNRAGVKSYGQGWLTAQTVLNRDRGCLDMMNDLLTIGVDFRKLVPSPTMTARQLVRHLAKKLFAMKVDEAQMERLIFFLSNDKIGEGPQGYASITPDFTDEYYTVRKVPRLVCLLSGMVEANLK